MAEKNEAGPAEVKAEVKAEIKTEIKAEIKTEVRTESVVPKKELKREIKTETFSSKPEKIRKKEKSPESFVPASAGPAPRGNPYGEWKTIQPK